jgi:hypothetical protein
MLSFQNQKDNSKQSHLNWCVLHVFLWNKQTNFIEPVLSDQIMKKTVAIFFNLVKVSFVFELRKTFIHNLSLAVISWIKWKSLPLSEVVFYLTKYSCILQKLWNQWGKPEAEQLLSKVLIELNHPSHLLEVKMLNIHGICVTRNKEWGHILTNGIIICNRIISQVRASAPGKNAS